MTAGQLPLFGSDDEGQFIYIVFDINQKWSVRRHTDGIELFSRDERAEAKTEAEARGYFLR